MARIFTLLLTLLILSHFTWAQSFTTINGSVKDSIASHPLAYATVKLLKTDSTSYASVITDQQGAFSFSNVALNTYILEITFQGYEPLLVKLLLTADSSTRNIGTLYMQPGAHELNTVTVKTAPMQLKGDTSEFNAGMYNVKPNATTEDLLKKLPGVEVDAQGNVKAQGETVQRVLVDGKRFFGDDAKIATQNLPSDIIDKIQVYDAENDQSEFTGFDDGTRTKTINIVTKPSRRHGYFGKITAGVGNNSLYDAGASVNKFNGDEQISFIGQVNNTNKQLFTVQDIFGSSGGGGRSGGGLGGNAVRVGAGGGGGGRGGGLSQTYVRDLSGTNNNGLTNTYSAGLNYRNQFGKTSVSGSYFYNNLKVTTDQNSLTENFITGDSSQFNNRNAASVKQTINHRINLNLETQFDSSNSLIIRPNASFQSTDVNSQTTTSITQGKLTNLSNTNATTSSHNNGYNGSVQATFRHKFNKKGRTFSLNTELSGSKKDGYGNNFSVMNDFSSSIIDTVNQHYTLNTNSNGINTTLAYTEPINSNNLLELNYSNTYNINKSDRITYDFDSASHDFNVLNPELTNQYQNTYNSNTVSLNYLYRTKAINFSAGTGVQFGNLTSENKSTDTTLHQHYTNLYPTVNLSYKISTSKQLRFNYSGRTNQPSVTQLQPVRDESDPTYIKIGNPDLGQEFTNSFRFLYSSFDRVHYRNLVAMVNASFTSNDIVNSVTILDDGTQITKPVNLNGSYNINAFFNFGFPLAKPKSNLNFNTNFTNSRSMNLVNDVRNNNLNYSVGESFRWTTNLKEKVDVNVSYTPTYNISKYTLQPDNNETYFTHTAMIEGTYYTKSGWLLSSNFNLTSYTGRADGYNTTIPLWNASLSKLFFKNKAGELKFSVNDILNQNKSVSRFVNENYVQDVTTKVLKRYFLLSFTYNLKNFGGNNKMPRFFGGDKNGPPNMPPPPSPDNAPPSPAGS